MTLPKDKRGLGITSLKDCNMVMLSKWWWRFRIEKHALWRKVIWSFHSSSRTWNPILVRLTQPGVWKNIVTIGKDFKALNIDLNCLLVGSLGNGTEIRFWIDRWVSDVPLRVLYPSIFTLEHNKAIMVSHCYNLHQHRVTWLWRWKREFLLTHEKEQLADLLVRLASVSLTDTPDKWQWGEVTGQ